MSSGKCSEKVQMDGVGQEAGSTGKEGSVDSRTEKRPEEGN